jgi:hypothetical protein
MMIAVYCSGNYSDKELFPSKRCKPAVFFGCRIRSGMMILHSELPVEAQRRKEADFEFTAMVQTVVMDFRYFFDDNGFIRFSDRRAAARPP